MAIIHQGRVGNGRVPDETLATPSEATAEAVDQAWNAWPVSWTGVWVGALATVAVVLILGLCGVALGAHLVGREHRVVQLNTVGFWTLACSVASAFFAAVVGGWVAGKIAGVQRSEPAMIHGAIAWLVVTPMLVVLAMIGAGSYMGGWYGGLGSWATADVAPFERPDALGPMATEAERTAHANAMTEYRDKVRQWRADTPRATRNAALGAVTALLLGLIGSVIGGWMASGEPMTFTYYRTRDALPTPTV